MSETYPYEQLDGRRFQRLVQSLVTADHPRVQCFPTSGPDGGRDAVVMRHLAGHESLVDGIVYQVKFREPTPHGMPTANDLYEWVLGHLKKEAEKIAVLASRGAREFIFVSNVSASGHLGVGLRDRVQKWAEEHLKLPTTFWWRDDIDARLDRNSDLVFKFMLFRGPDSVRAYFQQIFNENKIGSHGIRTAARNNAVTALMLYLADRYQEEESLRFKQADLDMPVLEFFVDVAVDVHPQAFTQSREDALRHSFSQVMRNRAATQRSRDAGLSVAPQTDRHTGPGAAELIQSQVFSENFKRIVIEGVPGQGKSTLTQFLGQVNRALILGRTEDLSVMPEYLQSAPLRLPLRIELRHFSSWLQGGTPWSVPEEKRVKSIEAYLAAHISYSTGGLEFSPNDLTSIISATPTILMLDGLDEVVDIDVRSEIVKIAESFTKRLSTIGADLQVLVTSRPSAFSKSPVFSHSEFLYLTLEDLSANLIDGYTASWIKRKRISHQEAREFSEVLRGCLSQPHVADLARNPMQLAILLWLVYVKGWSLPDKRTALYEAYMTTFMDREADKNLVVRQYREPLLELHGYLGWILHSRAEVDTGGSSGDIALADLKILMREYFEREEGPVDLVDQLFHGVQRVFVLVERIEGRFEFEVQPLREFFAARHLYKTAPHYSNAVEVYGSRPDRLEALIRNPYWMNVARFFCGWYDKGELADLSRRLEDLCSDPSYEYLHHPRALISRLLGDYVTAASRRDTKQLVRQLTDALSLRLLQYKAAISRRSDGSPSLIIPREAGLSALIDSARSVLRHCSADEVMYDMARFIATQDQPADRCAWWLEEMPSEPREVEEWLRRGVASHSLSGLSTDIVEPLLNTATENRMAWGRGVEAGRFDVACLNPRNMERYLGALAEGHVTLSAPDTAEGRFAEALNRSVAASHYDPRWYNLKAEVPVLLGVSAEVDERISELRVLLGAGSSPPVYERHGPKELGDRAELVRKHIGEGWAAWRLAFYSGFGRQGKELVDFCDQSASLTLRASTAWKLRDDRGYWRSQFHRDVPLWDRAALMTAFLCLAPASIMAELQPIFRREWERTEPWVVHRVIRFADSYSQKRPSGKVSPILKLAVGDVEDLGIADCPCLASSFEPRMGEMVVRDLYEKVRDLPICDRHREIDTAFRLSRELKLMSVRKFGEQELLKVGQLYNQARSGLIYSDGVYRLGFGRRMTDGQASQIVSDPLRYPMLLLASAEERLSLSVMKNLPSMEETARVGQWFKIIGN
ncbi:hypothetical protein RKE29_03840 [Streptomyces sp. B1866]|uniref:NACHT domain-containing protein n=1 Tax=Streptomyces sp. B1866 TaxID=3075431 RepID=UPI00289208F7|nr:hypothetical protein [Streptomyces sp. B1866]MDT3395784.1 hypothetical protein [Streptomyces sp. B1866]